MMALEFSLRQKDGVFSLEPMAGMPRVEIRPPELTVPGGTYIKTPTMGDIEYDPPTKSFLQKLLFDWLQRANFAMAGTYRTEIEKGKGVLQERLTAADKELAAKYPNLTPATRDALAAEQVQKESYGLGAMFKQAVRHPFTPLLPPWGGGVKDPITAAGAAVIDLTLKKDSEGAAALWAGLSGTDKSMFMDVMEEEGLPRMLGLILDIGLDPINYLPWGMAVKATTKGIGKLPGVAAAVKAIKETNVVKTLGHLFQPGYKLPKKYWHLESFTRRRGFAEEADIIADLRKAHVGIQGNKQQVAELMLYVKQHPGALNEISVANQATFLKYADQVDRVGKKLVLGKYMPMSSYLKWKDTYMYGFYPNYTRVLSGNVPPTTFQRLAKASFSRPKKFANIAENKIFVKNLDLLKDAKSVDEAVDIAKMFRDPADINKVGAIETAIRTLDDMPQVKAYANALQASYTPEKNFLKLVGIYKVEASRLFRRDTFIKKVVDEFGTKVPNIFDHGTIPPGQKLLFPKGQIRFYPGGKAVGNLVDDFLGAIKEGDEFVEVTPEVSEFLLKLTKMTKGQVGVSKKVSAFLIDENIGARLNKVSTFFWGDPAAATAVRYLDKWHGLWKGMATAMRLPFHIRNAYSNVFLMYAADVNPAMIPRRMQQASSLALSRRFPRLAPTIKTQAGKVLSNKQILQRIVGDGAVRTGWQGAEAMSIWQQMDYFNKYGRLRAGLNPIEWGRKLGTIIEDNARGAVYIDRLIKGDSFQDAALAVFKSHYDYTAVGLTAFEANVAKRAAAFYTWTRKNTPHMIETLIMKPQKLANMGKVYRMMYDMSPETREERMFKPEYMDEQMWQRAPDWLPKMAGQTGPLYYHLDLPPESLGMIPEMLTGDWGQVLNLLTLEGLKPIVDLIRGQKDFPVVGMKLERFPRQKVPAPWFMAYTPEAIQKILEVGPYVDQKTGKVILGMRARNRHMLYSMFPVLAEGAKLYPQPIDVEMERAPWRMLTYVTGVGFMPVDLKQQKWLYQMQRTGKIGELQQFLLQEGRLPTEEEWKETQ